VDVDIGVAVSTGLGSVGVIASGFALFQNYSHKKLSLIMSSRIKDLEDDRAELKLDMKEQKVLLNDAIKKIESLEKEITSLKKALRDLISKSESLANRLSHIDEQIINHEEKLLKMARSAAEEAALSVSGRIIRAELSPAIQTIKYVEQSIEQIKRELKESSARAAQELEY
jgi:phage shock protein A